jgi:hypothetical protein
MKKVHYRFMLFISAFLLSSLLGTIAFAAPTFAPITGEIERITLNDPADIYSGGVMVVGGIEVTLPKNLLIDLPANRLTLRQIFDQAPAACLATGESGLSKADKCNLSGTGGIATLSAVNTTAGNVIAGDVLISKGAEALFGKISYIDYTQGFFRVNGLLNDPATGVMVRLNDPTSRHTIQSGAGCAGGPNCSPDPRFALDADNYTNTFATGYPLCIPSTVPRSFTDVLGSGVTISQGSTTGTNDFLCPASNRTPGVVLEPAVADSRRFAPIVVGDTISAEGNFETINGTRFLSAHTSKVAKALATKNQPDQPDYLFLEEVFLEAPAFQNQRFRALWIGFTTLAPTDVDIWSIHRDPLFNDIHEFPLASVQGCDIASGGVGTCSNQGLVNAGANIFRIRYDVDFLLASKFPSGTKDGKLSPCDHLRSSPRFARSNPGICSGGVTVAKQFGVMSPIPHEIIARTGHKLDNPAGSLITIDINGNVATNGQYLFPLGINLGGVEVADMLEVDLNALATPVIFEGIPWNLDRRLSPSGCLNGTCEAGALGTFALDPFPYSGLDPRIQADPGAGGALAVGLPNGAYSDPVYTSSSLSNVRNRIFSYVTGTKFNGNTTVIPYALGAFPADPPQLPINPTPALNIFAPITQNDTATINKSVPVTPVTIDVLANDIPVLGSILPGSVTITTNPASGNAAVNADGTITFTPATNFSGTVSFAYTVQNDFFAVSAPATVTVEVIGLLPATDATLIPEVVSPQTTGTVIALLATATGGDAGPYEYSFWWRPSGSTTYTLGRTWGTIPIWSWNTTGLSAGSYIVRVNVRHVGSSLAFESYKAISYNLTIPVVGTTLAPSVASPQPVGTAITFTAAAYGGVAGPYEYSFWWRPSGSTTYTLGQTWGTIPIWSWNTTGVPAGSYIVRVNVRHVGTTVPFEAYNALIFGLN